VAGNGVLQITGLPSDDNSQESHSYSCEGQCNANCKSISGSWQGGSYKLNYKCCRYQFGEVVCAIDKTTYISSFVHYPGTLGYLSYSTTPGMNQMFTTFLVKTFWKAYPVEVQYNLDQSTWKTVTSNLMSGQKQIAVSITGGAHTLYFSESSGYQTKFSWNLYIPVDATGDTYATTYTHDQYGNMTSVTNPQGHTTTYEYSADYDHAYLTSQTDMVDGQEITVSATYDFYLGLASSRTCACGSVTDYQYDVLGRMTKIIYPLVLGEQERAEHEVVYDDVNVTVTVFNENDEKTFVML
jgi:YD repeat-containing protein